MGTGRVRVGEQGPSHTSSPGPRPKAVRGREELPKLQEKPSSKEAWRLAGAIAVARPMD